MRGASGSLPPWEQQRYQTKPKRNHARPALATTTVMMRQPQSEARTSSAYAVIPTTTPFLSDESPSDESMLCSYMISAAFGHKGNPPSETEVNRWVSTS